MASWKKITEAHTSSLQGNSSSTPIQRAPVNIETVVDNTSIRKTELLVPSSSLQGVPQRLQPSDITNEFLEDLATEEEPRLSTQELRSLRSLIHCRNNKSEFLEMEHRQNTLLEQVTKLVKHIKKLETHIKFIEEQLVVYKDKKEAEKSQPQVKETGGLKQETQFIQQGLSDFKDEIVKQVTSNSDTINNLS